MPWTHRGRSAYSDSSQCVCVCTCVWSQRVPLELERVHPCGHSVCVCVSGPTVCVHEARSPHVMAVFTHHGADVCVCACVKWRGVL